MSEPALKRTKTDTKRVLITGASGMLGRALFRLLQQFPEEYTVLGTAYGRAKDPLVKLNLLDTEAVLSVFDGFQPDLVVHCAAERDPDRAAADPEGTRALNVGTTEMLAKTCETLGASMIYISTVSHTV